MNKRISIIGLPESGKTTFIAALWHLLDSNSEDDSIFLKELPESRVYLNSIRDKWLECEKQGRKIQNQIQKVELNIGIKDFENDILISIPDIFGEIFDTQWEHRIISRQYIETLTDVESLIIFIHSTEIKKPIQISHIKKIIDLSEKSKPKKENPPNIWQISEAPTQVKIVELIQFAMQILREKLKKVVILISAWDLFNKDGELKPEDWLEKEVPLLNQFILSNDDLFKTKIYGVSAQGGDFDKDKQLLIDKDPLKRVFIQDKKIIDHDIAKPLIWLLQ